MRNYLASLFSKLNAWKDEKIKESKLPITREIAYSMATIGDKHADVSQVTECYRRTVLENIKAIARSGGMYLLQKHPEWLSEADKEDIADYLKLLDFSIHYKDSKVMLISWKYQDVSNCKGIIQLCCRAQLP